MQQFSHLSRTFDFRLPSNVFAFAGSAAMGLVALIVERSFGTAFGVGLAAFLGWVLARELDPDRPLTAAITTVVGGALALVLPTASPGVIYLLVVAGRVLGRTTGLSPKWTDLAVHLPIAAWFSQTAFGWVAAMALSFAIARDAALPNPGPKWQVWWAAAMAVAATSVVTFSGGLGSWDPPSISTDAVLLLGVVGAVFLARPEAVSSVGDYTGEPLDERRVRFTRIVVSVAAAAAFLISGDEAIRALGAVWVAFAAGGAARIIRRS